MWYVQTIIRRQEARPIRKPGPQCETVDRYSILSGELDVADDWIVETVREARFWLLQRLDEVINTVVVGIQAASNSAGPRRCLLHAVVTDWIQAGKACVPAGHLAGWLDISASIRPGLGLLHQLRAHSGETASIAVSEQHCSALLPGIFASPTTPLVHPLHLHKHANP